MPVRNGDYYLPDGKPLKVAVFVRRRPGGLILGAPAVGWPGATMAVGAVSTGHDDRAVGRVFGAAVAAKAETRRAATSALAEAREELRVRAEELVSGRLLTLRPRSVMINGHREAYYFVELLLAPTVRVAELGARVADDWRRGPAWRETGAPFWVRSPAAWGERARLLLEAAAGV